MNDTHEQILKDEMLDRLVDGELSAVEYEETLRKIGLVPEGWRRCALAFLEAQAWRSEFPTVPRGEPATAVQPVGAPWRWTWRFGGLLMGACAASFLLALAVSLQILGRSWTGPDPNDFARYAPPAAESGDAPRPQVDPDTQLADSHPPELAETLVHSGGSAASELWPTGSYRLVVDGDAGPAQEIEMPVFAAGDPRASWLMDDEATAPHEIIQTLSRRGNEVQRHRNWIPVITSAGVPLYVPVDELLVTPVSNRAFQ